MRTIPCTTSGPTDLQQDARVEVRLEVRKGAKPIVRAYASGPGVINVQVFGYAKGAHARSDAFAIATASLEHAQVRQLIADLQTVLDNA